MQRLSVFKPQLGAFICSLHRRLRLQLPHGVGASVAAPSDPPGSAALQPSTPETLESTKNTRFLLITVFLLFNFDS